MIARFAVAVSLFLADVAAVWAQALPPGGGPMPELRRGANGQIEVVPTEPGRARNGPAAPPASRGGAPPSVRVAAPPPAPAGTPRLIIDVTPNAPTVPDTARGGTVVASYSVRMNDNSPFTGTVRFGPPYYDSAGKFSLRDNHIVVNPNGPGIGPNKTTIVDHITLEATPESRVGR